MRGYDFLDKLSLVDPAYIEAADLMPKKKTSWLKWGIAACLTLVLCTVTVFCKEQRDQLRVDSSYVAEIAPEEAGYQIPVHRSVVTRKMYVAERRAKRLQIGFQFLYLG